MSTSKYSQIALTALAPYPNNARTHSDAQIEKIAKSIQEFGFLNPVLINKDNMIIAGHGRVLAAEKLGLKQVPCLRVEHLTEAQVKAYILADNKLAEDAGWDMELVSQEIAELKDMDFDIDLTGFEMPELNDWFNRDFTEGASREEGNDEYNEFLDKFEAKKTTDDCYTPQLIYDTVADWVAKEYKRKREQFMRPFYPGGNYQQEEYKAGAVVVDNPPFSIISEICRFYCDRKIPFFLFAPGLTLFGSARDCDVCYIPIGVSVTYENGAKVQTSFITNLDKAKVRGIPELYEMLKDADDKIRAEKYKEMPKYSYPDEVITATKINYFSKYGIPFVVYPEECYRISGLDSQKDDDKSLFGSGFLLSEKAAAEKAAAEKAAAEKAAAHRWPLSERELAIVKSLGKGQKNGR